MKLWREYAKNMKHNYGNEETDERITDELQIIEEARREEENELELERTGEAEIQEDEVMETKRRQRLRDIIRLLNWQSCNHIEEEDQSTTLLL
jgi:hypothetical protein